MADSTAESTPSTQNQTTITLGTRASILARIQTDAVAKALRQAWPGIHCEIVPIRTTGDKDQKTALHAFNAKALWTTELEDELAKGKLDAIVHSLKDMPTQLPNNMTIGAITKREDPRDALVVHPSLSGKYTSLAALPAGSVVGTCSLRRMAQLKRLYPHLEFTDSRGNINTRLAKLDAPDSGTAALILAAAGLLRLGMRNRITSYLSSDDRGILFAVGQGAIAIEIRSNDEKTAGLVAAIADEWTTRQCLAERSLMRTLEGGCSVPIGVESRWVPKSHTLTGSTGGVGIKPFAQYDKITGVGIVGSEPVDRQEDAADRQRRGSSNLASAQAPESEETRSQELFMKAIVVSLDGTEAVEREMSRRVTSREEADEFGFDLARKLVDGGAGKILEAITLNRKIIAEQHNA